MPARGRSKPGCVGSTVVLYRTPTTVPCYCTVSVSQHQEALVYLLFAEDAITYGVYIYKLSPDCRLVQRVDAPLDTHASQACTRCMNYRVQQLTWWDQMLGGGTIYPTLPLEVHRTWCAIS